MHSFLYPYIGLGASQAPVHTVACQTAARFGINFVSADSLSCGLRSQNSWLILANAKAAPASIHIWCLGSD